MEDGGCGRGYKQATATRLSATRCRRNKHGNIGGSAFTTSGVIKAARTSGRTNRSPVTGPFQTRCARARSHPLALSTLPAPQVPIAAGPAPVQLPIAADSCHASIQIRHLAAPGGSQRHLSAPDSKILTRPPVFVPPEICSPQAGLLRFAIPSPAPHSALRISEKLQLITVLAVNYT